MRARWLQTPSLKANFFLKKKSWSHYLELASAVANVVADIKKLEKCITL